MPTFLQNIPIRISRESPMPIFAQLMDGIRGQIAEGKLRPGDPVPSVRTLIERSGLSSNTIQRALTQLAREGVVTTRRGVRSRIAQPRARSTEILLSAPDWPPLERAYGVDFFERLIAGVSAAYEGQDRRIVLTHLARGVPTGDELVQTARLRRADGLVAYRPNAEMVQALQPASHDVAVASIFRAIPKAPADIVAPTMAPLRALLQRRIEQGKRAFTFILGSEDAVLAGDASVEPYAMLYRTFQETLSAAGIKPMIEIYPSAEQTPERDRQVRERIREAEVIAITGVELDQVREKSNQAEWVFYTEHPRSVEILRGKVTLLYLGIECVGRAAADALASRVASGGALSARRIELAPELIEQSRKPL